MYKTFQLFKGKGNKKQVLCFEFFAVDVAMFPTFVSGLVINFVAFQRRVNKYCVKTIFRLFLKNISCP